MRISNSRALEIIKNQGKALGSIHAIPENLRSEMIRLTESLTPEMVGTFNPDAGAQVPKLIQLSVDIMRINNGENKKGRAIANRLGFFYMALNTIFTKTDTKGLEICLAILELIDDIADVFDPID